MRDLILTQPSLHKFSPFVMPDLIRHPGALEKTGFRLEFIPMKIGAGMTPYGDEARFI